MPATFQPRRMLGAGIVLLATVIVVVAGPPASAEARGRAVFRDGLHADGTPVAAVTGDQALPLPDAFVACIHCHGQDGRGKTDGGITTSDIRWDTLAKPYELTTPNGRRRSPYNPASFFTAVTQGIDSNGRALDAAMPRFRLSMAEASDLIAYLQDFGRSTDEGVADDVLRIGFALPTDPTLSTTAKADRKIVEAWLDQVNRQGGAFRRRLELVDIEASAPSAVLAILHGEWAESPVTTASAAGRIPSLRVIAGPSGRYEFALYPGVVERASALLRHAAARSGATRPQVGLVYDATCTSRAVVDAVLAAVRPLASVEATPIESAKPEDTIQEMRAAGVNHVLLLGQSPAFAALLANAQSRRWDPLFLSTDPAAQNADNLRAIGARSAPAAAPAPEARAEYEACVARSGLNPTKHDQTRQLALLAAARLLVDALNTAGREVNREKLVESLEALRDIRSGFGPVGGLSARRHIVAASVLIAPLPGSRYRPEPEWVSID